MSAHGGSAGETKGKLEQQKGDRLSLCCGCVDSPAVQLVGGGACSATATPHLALGHCCQRLLLVRVKTLPVIVLVLMLLLLPLLLLLLVCVFVLAQVLGGCVACSARQQR